MSSHNETLHAVVTGGGRGIGAAIAQNLDSSGLSVTIMGRNEASLVRQCKSLQSAEYCVVDVSAAPAVQAAFSRLAPVEVLINNAGSAPSAPFAKITDQHWHDTFNVNVHGAFYCSRAVVPHMVKADYGRIINIASTSALKGYSYVAAYCAAKHGLLGLTRAMASEYAQTGVTINAVCPGFAETDLLSGAVANIVEKTGRSESDARAALYANNPQKRFIQPQEVAATVAWLLQDTSASITGQAISVSGGEVT
jgi:NAD(P)-dependent dehydrogenase (short-subunit alcohol dehydrogenase family)